MKMTNHFIGFILMFRLTQERKLVTNRNFENTKLDLLKRAKRMGFVITMGAGPALNANSPGSLKLRSSATAYLVIE
jgi:hypothetical protein